MSNLCSDFNAIGINERSLLTVARGYRSPFRRDNEAVARTSSVLLTVIRSERRTTVPGIRGLPPWNLRVTEACSGFHLHRKPSNSTTQNDTPIPPFRPAPKAPCRHGLFRTSCSATPPLPTRTSQSPTVTNGVSPVGQSRKGCTPQCFLPSGKNFDTNARPPPT